MRVENGAIIMEQNPSNDPGRFGDSCAETARLYLLLYKNVIFPQRPQLDLIQFRTKLGYVRHPLSIWKENDFSTDQALPLYLALTYDNPALRSEMENRIKDNWFKTGNGDFISPTFFAFITRQQWLLNQSLKAQAYLFKLPYRWNDETKWFEKTNGTSSDYLNWIHSAKYASSHISNLIPKDVLKQKVRDYYKPEPNSDWIVKLYDNFIELL